MHLSSRKEWFRDYDNTILVKIYMGENSIQEAIGKGNMDVTMEIGENVVRKTFTDALHVPKIIKILFSMSKVVSQSHMFEFQNKSCTQKNKNNHVVGEGIPENRFYKL